MSTAHQRREEVRAAEREARRAAEDFNDAHPIGTRVIAYPGSRDGWAMFTKTRTPAWNLGHGQPVVSVEGYAGGIALTHVDVIDTDAPTDELAAAEALVRQAMDDAWDDGREFEDLPAVLAQRIVAAAAQARPTDDREWTDAELDAAYAAFHAHSGSGAFNEFNEYVCAECGYALSWPDAPMDGGKRAKRHAAREALAAARNARQEQNR